MMTPRPNLTKNLLILLSFGIFLHLFSGCRHDQRTEDISLRTSVKVTGLYSDMYFNKEGGDLLGIELFIVNSKNGYYVLYQESVGEPISLGLAPLQVSGDRISFIIPDSGSSPGPFTARITSKALSGKLGQSGYDLRLERKQSYWVDNTPALQKTGMYSNMHDDGAGGVIGFEFFVVLFRESYFVLFQDSQGTPNIPMLLPIEFTGSEISFSVPSNGRSYGEFIGRVSPEGLKGKFSGDDDKEVTLRRANSYWQ